MKNKTAILILACTMAIGCSVSCGSGESKSTLIAERDSLLETNQEQAKLLDGLNATIDEISLMMDSITVHEDGLFLSDGTNKEIVTDRQIIRNHIKAFEQMLARQKERVRVLEEKLKNSGASNAKLQKVIDMMKLQIDQKDKEITELRTQLQDSKKSIAELRTHVSTLNQHVSTLTERNAAQEETIMTQDNMLNECYFLIASKKKLKSLGILSGGGLFKKSKAQLNNLPTEAFQAVDIRHFTEIHIDSKKVKLLTPAPSNSYKLIEDGSGYTLTITDPSSFWTVSNYLVIQAD